MARGKRDEETGVEPVARDGEPNGDAEMESEIERRRQLKEQRERGEEAQVQGKRGQPIDDQQSVGEEDDGQLFVWEQGRKVTLGTLIDRRTPVEHAFLFRAMRVPGSGGLVGFDDDVLVVARGKMRGTHVVATRDGDENVTKVTVVTEIDPKVIAPADSDHALDMLAGVFDRRGIKAA